MCSEELILKFVTPECLNRGSSPLPLDSRQKHSGMTDSKRSKTALLTHKICLIIKPSRLQ